MTKPGPPLMPAHRAGRRAVALVLVAGVLALLAALGGVFYALIYAHLHSAVRYSDAVRAELLARAGVQEALARLRESAHADTGSPAAPWFPIDYLKGKQTTVSFAAEGAKPYTRALGGSVDAGSDRYAVRVEDAAGKINLNAGDNLAVILDNLCRLLGPPLVAADADLLIPMRWRHEDAGYRYGLNPQDLPAATGRLNRDIYFESGADGRPITWAEFLKKHPLTEDDAGGGRARLTAWSGDPAAVYGDGYALAGYRARHGRFHTLEELKAALTYVERSDDGVPDDPLEQFEIEVKFAALRPYLTLHSWVDTQTTGVGKFEWAEITTETIAGASLAVARVLLDRDKSWVEDDPAGDPRNERGSLRGCTVSILNGHGGGQLRRIKTNGIDWLEVDQPFVVPPGPVSSYLIVAQDDALAEAWDAASGSWQPVAKPAVPDGSTWLPRMGPDGTLVDDPGLDYATRPLCIHRAPVNVNTASEVVLAALCLGLNVQAGHPLAVGTDADPRDLNTDAAADWSKADLLSSAETLRAGDLPWYVRDFSDRAQERYLVTRRGVRRIPAKAGRPVWDVAFDDSPGSVKKTVLAACPEYDLDYLNGYDTSDPGGTRNINDAQAFALRVVLARQADPAHPNDPLTDAPRGPFRSWDDFYFRVVRPWDDARLAASRDAEGRYHKQSVARLVMAHYNGNADLLKFNPNIEWIDRWGRNFSELEPVMAYSGDAELPDWLDYAWPPPYDAGAGPPPPDSPQVSGGMWPYWLVHHAKKRRGCYVLRSLRYKADELIDKSDLNRSTTEVCFDSNGVYEISGLGQVLHPLTGQLLAERKYAAVVKLYDVWRESTQRQFAQGRISAAAWCPELNPAKPGSYYLPAPDNVPLADGSRVREWTYQDSTAPPYDGFLALQRRLGATGKVVRDGYNGQDGAPIRRLALETLPEPLVPLNYTIRDGCAEVLAPGVDAQGRASGAQDQELASYLSAGANRNSEVVGGTARGASDAWGHLLPNGVTVPEVLKNRVLPANYDGQIVLATNTARWSPASTGGANPGWADDEECGLAGPDYVKDWRIPQYNGSGRAGALSASYWMDGHDDGLGFLASFNGDLDTECSLGNGREQAKTPNNRGIRVVDTFSLLGLLNDQQIDADPVASDPLGRAFGSGGLAIPAASYDVFTVRAGCAAMRRLDERNYWENVTCRTGDLRPEGVWLGAVGISGKDATLKYCTENNTAFGESAGAVAMWLKPAWHATDHREHEFINFSTPGLGEDARHFQVCKAGRFTRATPYGAFGRWAAPYGIFNSKEWTFPPPLELLPEWTLPNWDAVRDAESLCGAGGCYGDNDLMVALGSTHESGGLAGCFLHGGTMQGRTVRSAEPLRESPAYRVQPFRWTFVGVTFARSKPATYQTNNYSCWAPHGGAWTPKRSPMDSYPDPGWPDPEWYKQDPTGKKYSSGGGTRDFKADLTQQGCERQPRSIQYDACQGPPAGRVLGQSGKWPQRQLLADPRPKEPTELAAGAAPYGWGGIPPLTELFGNYWKYETHPDLLNDVYLEDVTWNGRDLLCGFGEQNASFGARKPNGEREYTAEPFWYDLNRGRDDYWDEFRHPRQLPAAGNASDPAAPGNYHAAWGDPKLCRLHFPTWPLPRIEWKFGYGPLGPRYVSGAKVSDPRTGEVSIADEYQPDPAWQLGLRRVRNVFPAEPPSAVLKPWPAPAVTWNQNGADVLWPGLRFNTPYNTFRNKPSDPRTGVDGSRSPGSAVGWDRSTKPLGGGFCQECGWSFPTTWRSASGGNYIPGLDLLAHMSLDPREVDLFKPTNQNDRHVRVITVERLIFADPQAKAPQTLSPTEQDNYVHALQASARPENYPDPYYDYKDHVVVYLNPWNRHYNTVRDVARPFVSDARDPEALMLRPDPDWAAWKPLANTPDGWQQRSLQCRDPQPTWYHDPARYWPCHDEPSDADDGGAKVLGDNCTRDDRDNPAYYPRTGSPEAKPVDFEKNDPNQNGVPASGVTSNVYLARWMRTRSFKDAFAWTSGGGQPAAYPWQDGWRQNIPTVFSINNLNEAGPCATAPGGTPPPPLNTRWIYRTSPADGTLAVVDELRVAKKKWNSTRIWWHMTTSRYYLPWDPAAAGQCPTFTSQTLWESLQGRGQTPSDQNVTLLRVAWTAFTPRFMHENRYLHPTAALDPVGNPRQRREVVLDHLLQAHNPPQVCEDPHTLNRDLPGHRITQAWGEAALREVRYRGPFDYVQYNRELLNEQDQDGHTIQDANPLVTVPDVTTPVLGVDRPAPFEYRNHPCRYQPHATRGVEVELIRDEDGTPGSADDQVSPSDTRTVGAARLGLFTDPDQPNALGSASAPVTVKVGQLRYRVRFRYPVDPLVEAAYRPGEAPPVPSTVSSERHFLVDTPVFDDLAVLYATPVRILEWREDGE